MPRAKVPFVATVQTASGGAVTGTVTFYHGAAALGTATVSSNAGHNAAQFTSSGLLGGAHTITAAYSGDANDMASTFAALTETINPAGSTVSASASSSPASFGQAVILTATVAPSIVGGQATGAVTFFDGATSLGAANLSSNAAQISVANFALGSHSITATCAGDRNFAGSTSAALSLAVNPAATSTVVTSSGDPAVVNTNVTFTATVSSIAFDRGNAKRNRKLLFGWKRHGCGDCQSLEWYGQVLDQFLERRQPLGDCGVHFQQSEFCGQHFCSVYAIHIGLHRLRGSRFDDGCSRNLGNVHVDDNAGRRI